MTNPLDEPGTFVPTSTVLPTDQFPQFASEAAGGYEAAGGPFDPVEGDWYAGAVHVDDSYMRLTRTFDLSGVAAAATPTLRAQLSFDTEAGYDHVIVEAHPVGSDDWTTLPETGGLTSTAVPTECEAGFLLEEHPFLEHYLTPGNPCTATGSSGTWNAMTGSFGRLEDRQLRPVGVRRTAGRGVDQLRHRPGDRRGRGLRRRHGPGGRRRR